MLTLGPYYLPSSRLAVAHLPLPGSCVLSGAEFVGCSWRGCQKPDPVAVVVFQWEPSLLSLVTIVGASKTACKIPFSL